MKLKYNRIHNLGLTISILSLVVVSSAHAVNYTWDGSGGANDNINTSQRWVAAPNFAQDNTSNTVTFGTGGSAATVNTNVHIGGIFFNRDANFTIANGTGSLTVGASGITVTLPNTTARSHTISESSLILSANQTWSVTNNTVLAQLTVSSVISGGFGIDKTGTGTLTLSGANSYTGKTTVSGGILALGLSGSVADSSEVALNGGNFNVSAATNFALGSTQALTGSGTVTGSVKINGALDIGTATPGLVSFVNNLTLGLSSTSKFSLTGAGLTGDLGSVAGNLTIDTGAILDLVQLGTYTANEKFTLFSYTGTFAGVFKDMGNNTLADDSTFTDASGIWKINYNDTTAGLNGGTTTGASYVTVTAVPEPGAALLGGIGLLALLRRRSRN